MKITLERWQQAQEAERKHHTFSREEGRAHYFKTYQNYFEYLGIDFNHEGKVIAEIGCADFPALEHCIVRRGILIEPMPSELLKELVNERKDLSLIVSPVEELDFRDKCVDEIWLLNVMQHVIDPDLFIKKCKQAAKIIRFFEPINWPIEVYHPHTFTFEYYKSHFPDAKLYKGDKKDFHTAECAYGTWSQV
jgi:hypothetical protein